MPISPESVQFPQYEAMLAQKIRIPKIPLPGKDFLGSLTTANGRKNTASDLLFSDQDLEFSKSTDESIQEIILRYPKNVAEGTLPFFVFSEQTENDEITIQYTDTSHSVLLRFVHQLTGESIVLQVFSSDANKPVPEQTRFTVIADIYPPSDTTHTFASEHDISVKIDITPVGTACREITRNVSGERISDIALIEFFNDYFNNIATFQTIMNNLHLKFFHADRTW